MISVKVKKERVIDIISITRSFFIVKVNVGFIYVAASSCLLEGKTKTPAESEVLHANQLRCHKRFSSCLTFVRL